MDDKLFKELNANLEEAVKVAKSTTKQERFPRKGDTFDEYWEQYLNETCGEHDDDKHDENRAIPRDET